jgi:hypothetical protein
MSWFGSTFWGGGRSTTADAQFAADQAAVTAAARFIAYGTTILGVAGTLGTPQVTTGNVSQETQLGMALVAALAAEQLSLAAESPAASFGLPSLVFDYREFVSDEQTDLPTAIPTVTVSPNADPKLEKATLGDGSGRFEFSFTVSFRQKLATPFTNSAADIAILDPLKATEENVARFLMDLLPQTTIDGVTGTYSRLTDLAFNPLYDVDELKNNRVFVGKIDLSYEMTFT